MYSKFINSFPAFFSRIVYWELRQVFPLITKLMVSGQLSKGCYREELTQFIRKHFSVLECITLDSGSSAIELALDVFKRLNPHRDRVIVPVYICPSVIQAVKRANIKPCFVSVGKDLTLNPEDLKNKLNKDILAVIIPHLYGYPAKISKCVQVIKQADPTICIIDDAAPTFDTMIQKRKLGTWGDVGILSFGPSKKLTATGGGALLVSNVEVLKIVQERIKAIPEPSEKEIFIKFLRFWRDFVCIRYSPAINYWYTKYTKFILSSYRSYNLERMSNLDAALILWMLKHKDNIHKRRSQIMEYYIKELQDVPGLSFPQENAHSFCVSRFYMRTSGLTMQRNQKGEFVQGNPLVSYLDQHGIRAGYGYIVLTEDLGMEGSKLREEQHKWLDELVWLPVDHKRDSSHYEIVVKSIKSFFETYQKAY